MAIQLLLLAYFYGVVASSNETTTIATVTTTSALETLKDVIQPVNQTSSSATPEVTTLPSLPEEGEVKSRRKPSLKEQEGSETKQKDLKIYPAVTTDINEMDVEKDSNIKSSIKSRKGAPTKSPHGKKEIRNEEENNLDGEKDAGNISPNVTSILDDIVTKENNGTISNPSSDIMPTNKKEGMVNVDNKTEPPETTTTETAFKVHSSIVKIVPLKENTKPETTTLKGNALQNVELPKSVSVGLNPSPSATSSIDKMPSEKENAPENERNGSAGLIVGIFFGMVLTAVLVFVGLKRLDAVRRRREYRRMNDFLIDGMYNDA